MPGHKRGTSQRRYHGPADPHQQYTEVRPEPGPREQRGRSQGSEEGVFVQQVDNLQ